MNITMERSTNLVSRRLIVILVLSFIYISLSFSFAFAGGTGWESIKGIEFTDGSVIRGKILQMDAGTITIETPDGQIHTKRFSDAKRFIKDDAEFKHDEATQTAPSYKNYEPPAVPYTRKYFSLGGGSGGDSGSSNGRIEGGYFTVNNNLNYLLGIGFVVTFNRSETPSDVNDYPVPHSYYRTLGWKKDGEEYGPYLKFGLEPIKGSGLFIFGLGGFTYGREILLAQSLATGWYYNQESDDKFYGLYGGGIGYYGARFPINVQASWDNRMGFVGMIGISW